MFMGKYTGAFVREDFAPAFVSVPGGTRRRPRKPANDDAGEVLEFRKGADGAWALPAAGGLHS
jgi:hypothetical protein